ncbi:hypothetical protein [Paludibacterium paludis]|uniref:Flagellar biosynthetic protein FliO n=1 Tax=Paludibacterium paludis TaxID=1225769 RepID=A0A918P6P1_9NEIS|nr:hypothetical protein [Paludibacterium paludis]GGY28915.1 hypothetical protein GCM10011289_35110 [Paludibacterium paludis]
MRRVGAWLGIGAACLGLTLITPALAAGEASDASAPGLRLRREDSSSNLRNLTGSYGVAGSLLLAAAGVYGWRRRLSAQREVAPDVLQVRQRTRLSPKTVAYVLNHRGREYVLLESDKGVTVLDSGAHTDPQTTQDGGTPLTP